MSTIPLFGVVHSAEVEEAALTVLRSGRIASGEHVPKFEAGIASIVGQPNVVATVDMTSAMFLALQLAGVRQGDEVLTTAFACMATNSAIAQVGAKPIWVDVKPRSVEIDLADVLAKIGSRTKALILYHVAGYPGPARELAEICRLHGVTLIEDCDNALFATRSGEHVGTHGDFSVFSFYPNRQINCTEGGALVCRSSDAATQARKLRRFGIDASSFRTEIGEIDPRSDIPKIGWAVTMSNLCAAIGCTQLDSAADLVEKARLNVAVLSRRFSDCDGIEVINAGEDANPAFWVMLVFVPNRDKVLQQLRASGIIASKLHQRNDIYTGFASESNSVLPNTDYLQSHILAIPCGWWLEPAQVVAIGNALVSAVRAAGEE